MNFILLIVLVVIIIELFILRKRVAKLEHLQQAQQEGQGVKHEAAQTTATQPAEEKAARSMAAEKDSTPATSVFFFSQEPRAHICFRRIICGLTSCFW
jgi:hypothetical protein